MRLGHIARQPFCPIREFIQFSLDARLFGLVAAWLESRKGWTPENTRCAGFHIAPLPGSDQGIDPVSYRLTLEAIKIRDLELFNKVPPIRLLRCSRLNQEIAQFLTKELLADPTNEILFQMTVTFFLKNKDSVHHLLLILKRGLSNNHLALVKKILIAFHIPIEMRRELLHYPFDQSLSETNPKIQREYREIITLLDPEFEIPSWLAVAEN